MKNQQKLKQYLLIFFDNYYIMNLFNDSFLYVEVKKLKSTFYLEFYGKQLDQADLVKTAKAIWTKSGKKASDLTSLQLYVKPEENMVYYVFNEDETGSFSID